MPEIMEEQEKSVSQILRTNKILQKVEAEMALLKTRKSISFFPISWLENRFLFIKEHEWHTNSERTDVSIYLKQTKL